MPVPEGDEGCEGGVVDDGAGVGAAGGVAAGAAELPGAGEDPGAVCGAAVGCDVEGDAFFSDWMVPCTSPSRLISSVSRLIVIRAAW